MTDLSNRNPPMSRASRRLLQLSLVTPRPCPTCGGCICLTPAERRSLRRVTKIARRWRRWTRREAQLAAKQRAEAQNLGQLGR